MTIHAEALGPTTERRFAEAFAKGATITLAAAADLLNIDEKTLKGLTAAGMISACPRGPKSVGYSEVALRSYLLSPPATAPAKQEEKATCQSTSRRRAASGTTTSSTKVVGFMEARASRLAARRKHTSAG